MKPDPIVLGPLPEKPKLKSKTPNNKLKPKKENKKVTVQKDALQAPQEPVQLLFLGEYFNVHTMQMHPITSRFVEREAIKLKAWADEDSSLNLYDFIDAQGYSPKMFYEWCDKYSPLEAAHGYALRRIGSRRELGAMNRRFAEATVHRTLGHYSDVWKKETIQLARLKEEVSAQNETKVVVIERFPEMGAQPSQLTPEQVAGAIHKATGDAREYGPQGPWKKLQNKEE